MPQCQKCKTFVNKNDHYCHFCGNSLAASKTKIVCQGCDKTITNSNFCQMCGIGQPARPLKTGDCPRSPDRHCQESEHPVNGIIVCQFCNKILREESESEKAGWGGSPGGGTY